MKRLWWLIAGGCLIAFAGWAAATWTRPADEPADVPAPAEDPVAATPPITNAIPSPIRFAQVPPEESGVAFQYYGSPSDQHYMTEQNGGGIALCDADADGRLDLFFTNGSHFQNSAAAAGATQRLFRQADAWRFNDVTAAAGLTAFGFGQGCAAADYDHDGFCDLFVAGYRDNRLWRNNGDGTFTEMTLPAGIGSEYWSTSAAFADLDADGHNDLYVVNYVDWTPDRVTGKRIPSPMDFEGQPDQLYRNLGNGQFAEVGADAGVAIRSEGKGLALAISDLDADSLPDIYVANDTTRNFLFHNRGDMQFDEIGIVSGTAVSQDGAIGSSMGVAVGDFDRNELPDLFVTNFSGELLDAFQAIAPLSYVASSTELGIDPLSRHKLNFGIVLTDLDADGWLDLFFANGHLWDATASGGEYRMCPSLLRNVAGERFVDAAGGFSRCVRRGFQASHDDRILLPVGAAEIVDEVRVHWIGGDVGIWKRLPVDGRLTVLIQGSASAWTQPRP